MSWFESLEWLLLLAGFAALHLTWQTFVAGAVVAALAGVQERLSPHLRYWVALVLMLSLPLLALTTAGLIAASRGGEVASAVSASAVPGSIPWIAHAVPWIGLLWALGVLAGGARLLGGAIYTRRLAKSGLAADAVLLHSTNRLVERLGIRRPTSVRLSDEFRVPSVVGLLSATVLLPPRVLGELEPEEVDAILAHELSHVRRRDLLANAAQRMASALLFFHPVAAWISRTIDQDRELCCDELVARIGVPRRTYARALTRLALSNGGSPVVGLGAATGDVAARVRRLMASGLVPPRHQAMLPVLALVLVTLVGWSIATHALLPATARAGQAAPAWQARVLADVPGSYSVEASDPAGDFTLVIANGRAVAATVAGSALTRKRIRQRGTRVTLQADRPGETFSVTLLPGGGIEWPARPQSARD